jgi:uncharacterized repeat protein (TIGR02543 family)
MQDLNLYAKWIGEDAVYYTVLYNTLSEDTVPRQRVVHGELAPQPSAPTHPRFTFGGWYTGTDFATPWRFNTDVVTANITLHARWTCTVRFNSMGGGAVKWQVVEVGGVATRPPNPARANKTFVNWYTDQCCTVLYDFDAPVVGNMRVYARWE